MLYLKIINEVIVVSSTETAEMVKLENTFRAINIGLANEIAIMCEKLGSQCLGSNRCGSN